MFAPHIRGRRRVLDQPKKAELCDLIAHGKSVEEAAEVINVSVRTVQREMKLDEDFHHEVQVSLGHAPDPLKLMQQAARAHWRAAAWLLERTNPEQYARRPKSSASPAQFQAGLECALEAALEAVAPEQRTAVYQKVHAACEHAFKCVFPTYGPWGKPNNPKLPPTPLADQERHNTALSKPPSPRTVHKAGDGIAAPRNSRPRNARDIRPIAPRRPNVSRYNHRFLSPKTRITTKRTADNQPQNNAPVSREAAAERSKAHKHNRARSLSPSETTLNFGVAPHATPGTASNEPCRAMPIGTVGSPRC